MKIRKTVNYYEVLGLEFDFSKSDIKKAYRDLSKKWHPDKNKGDDSKFKDIAEAYKVLSDIELREEYDRISRFGKNFDITTELYEFEFSNQNHSYNEMKGQKDSFKKKDLRDILIKLSQFQESVEYLRYVGCRSCDETGMDINSEFAFECDVCEGKGKLEDNECFACKGRGKMSFETCKVCNSQRRIEKKEKVKLQESKFKENEDGDLMIKLESMGNRSLHEGKIGNLYVIIKKEE